MDPGWIIVGSVLGPLPCHRRPASAGQLCTPTPVVGNLRSGPGPRENGTSPADADLCGRAADTVAAPGAHVRVSADGGQNGLAAASASASIAEAAAPSAVCRYVPAHRGVWH